MRMPPNHFKNILAGFQLFAVLFCAAPIVLGQTSGVQVLSVEVEGNRTADASLIITMSGLTVGKTITTEDIQNAVKRIYSLAVFNDVQILDVEQTPEGIRLKIIVEEYPALGTLIIRGNREIDLKKIEEELLLTPGQVITPQKILRGQRAILSLYNKEGFLLCTVTHETKPSTSDGRLDLVFTIDEGRKVKIKAIDIEGNAAFDDKKIRHQMKTKQKGFLRSGSYEEEKFTEDLKRIAEFYKREGYRDAEIISHSMAYDDSLQGMAVNIVVSEGQPYFFGTISWEGNTLHSDETLQPLLTFAEGQIYNQEEYDKTQEELHTAYTEQGYLYVQIVPRETVRRDTVDIHFTISEGIPAKIHRIDIAGNTKTRDYVIRRELFIKPAELFRSSILQRSIREVYQLNFFNDVQIDPEPLPNGDLDLTIRVEEKPTGQANFAAGYSATDKMVGSIGFSIPNFRGMGQLVSFAYDFGQVRKTFQIGFSEPWLFGSRTSFGFDAYSSTRDWTGYYDEGRTGAALKIGRRLKWPDDYFRTYASYRVEQIKYTDIAASYSDPAGLRSIDWPRTTSSLSFSLIRDSRDLPEFATSGSVNSYGFQIAGGWLGGDDNYFKHTFDTYWHFPLHDRFSVLMKGQAGVVRSFGKSTYVPFFERFFPGGTSSDGQLRGYDDRSVGPRSQGTETGGLAMLLFTMEGQVPIVEHSIYGVLFADAGNAWSSLSRTDPFDMQRSVGFGIRIVAPMVGIIGIDLAYRLDDLYEQKKGAWQPHFQMGTSF